VNHDASERNAAEVINSENIDGSVGNLSYLVSINQILRLTSRIGFVYSPLNSIVFCFLD